MRLDRRSVLGLSGGALLAGLAPRLVRAQQMQRLRLIEPQGRPSLIWGMFYLMQPGLQQLLNCNVGLQTIPGLNGFEAIHAVLQSSDDDVGLFGAEVMSTQYSEKTDIRLENMTPIAKLMNGFSVALFARRGGPQTWAQLAAAKRTIQLSTQGYATATYIAALMVQRKGRLPVHINLRRTIDQVIGDVNSGQTDVGLLPTIIVARNQDRFQPILTFGAEKSAMLNGFPTFSQVTDNPKLSFTESIGVFGSPQLSPDLAARLTNAFILAGNNPDVQDQAEAADVPLALNRPNVLVATMERNKRVLERILG
jgi:tripartite-type tricarboxylate transporter receptor subunit TctC